MLQNYLTIAFRSLWRTKAHTIINILGLSLGISCCLLIILFVRDELTFDTFHSKAGRIYRAYVKEDWGDNQQFFNTVTPFPLGPVLKDNFEEVEAQVRFNPIGAQVKVGDHQYSDAVVVAGKQFFEVFDFQLIRGDRTALHQQQGVVISRRIAEKYFGTEDPINKVLSVQLSETFEEFEVKAVVENIPTNSSLRFDILISDLNFPKFIGEQTLTSSWFNVSPETYILLKEGRDKAWLESKFPSLFRSLLGDSYTKSHYVVGLQPLTSIHLDTSFPNGIAAVSDPKYSYILSAIALLILFVACINFVTLSVGRSLKRAREVGIRKVVGAERKQLILQFIGEAVIVTLISLVIGILLAMLGLPLFNDLAGKQLAIPVSGFLVLVLLALVTIIGIAAGSYPAFVLSAFRPVSVLKGVTHGVGNRQGVRKILVGVQLTLSVFLISSTLVMRQQLRYLKDKNLGFNKEHVLVVQLNVARTGRLAERVKAGFEKAEQFKNELRKFPSLSDVCAASHDFANGEWTNAGFTDDKGTYRTFNFNVIDADYMAVMKMEMAAGRSFLADNIADTRGIIVNEAFAREYGWDDPIGKRIPGKRFPDHEIIGVVKDFNYASLYTKVEPLVMVEDPAIVLAGLENINIDNSPLPKLFIRLRPGNIAASVEQLKDVWNRLTSHEEFTFSFIDQALAEQYRNDQNLGKIVMIATVLAIIIGSLGLYALASLAMQNRTREISIRKVMGATERSLLVLLSKDYVYMLSVALVFSVPVTWYLMSGWLKNFEYRISIGMDVFLLAGGISLVIAIVTISYQTFKTASAQPAKTLKYE
jgi:putative ABC transport system permease protein